MVVLAISIINKSGKALVSRQFVSMTRVRIEGLLNAFPRLLATGKQHTYIETESVRYVYQPIEALYLLLVTNKQSNILEDMETLRILSKLVPEYSPSLDEEGISQNAFELIFAFDEVISLGHKENVDVLQVQQFCKMESHEEKLFKLERLSKINQTKEIMKLRAKEIEDRKNAKYRGDKGGLMPITESRGIGFKGVSTFGVNNDTEPFYTKFKVCQPSSTATPPECIGMQLRKTQRANKYLESLRAEGEVILEDAPTSSSTRETPPELDLVTFTIEEKINVVAKRDGGIITFDVLGTLSLHILKEEDGFIQFQTENSDTPGLNFVTHPDIDKQLFRRELIVGSKDPNRPFPTRENDVGLMKWRIQGMEEGSLPMNVNCWPSVSVSETNVIIEYEASDKIDLSNIVISVPLPALGEPPNVRQIDGKWRHDVKNSTLEWSIMRIDNSNRSGSMEFDVPSSDSSAFFPIDIKFTAASTFSDVKVIKVMPLRGGQPPKFSQRIQLAVENYQVI